MNWGYKLAFASALFMTMIIYFVYRAHQQPLSLVSENYYEDELQYQTKIDAMNNSKLLHTTVHVQNNFQDLQINFPWQWQNKYRETEILLYNIASSNDDRIKKFTGNDSILTLSITTLKKGAYIAKINVNLEGEKYYFEEKFNLP